MRCSSCEALCSIILWGGGVALASHLLGDAAVYVFIGVAIVAWVAAKFIGARNVASLRERQENQALFEKAQRKFKVKS